MRRKLLFLFLALASCSRGSRADLPAISEARSLGAEWALVNEQARQGHLTPTYARTMRESLRAQLQSTAKSLTHSQSSYATEMAALIGEPDEAPPDQLRTHVNRLKQIEKTLESA